jgi:hypothetical protein
MSNIKTKDNWRTNAEWMKTRGRIRTREMALKLHAKMAARKYVKKHRALGWPNLKKATAASVRARAVRTARTAFDFVALACGWDQEETEWQWARLMGGAELERVKEKRWRKEAEQRLEQIRQEPRELPAEVEARAAAERGRYWEEKAPAAQADCAPASSSPSTVMKDGAGAVNPDGRGLPLSTAHARGLLRERARSG